MTMRARFFRQPFAMFRLSTCRSAGIYPRCRRLLGTAVTALTMALVPSSARAADIVLSIGHYQQTSAGGSFEVDLTVQQSASQSYGVAGFSIELSVPNSDQIQFSSVSTSTTSSPYIFDGTGTLSVDPNFMFSSSNFPTTDFAAADVEWSLPSITVMPGATFGLALVTYSITPGPPGGTVPIIFESTTSVTDADGNPIAFTSQNGAIQTMLTVPEPSSLVMGFLSATLVGGIVALKRSRT